MNKNTKLTAQNLIKYALKFANFSRKEATRYNKFGKYKKWWYQVYLHSKIFVT